MTDKGTDLLREETIPSIPPVLVYVAAPATLPAGYTFDAQVQGFSEKAFSVVVPAGGVTEGQEFLVPLPEDFGGARIDVPTGRWKDSLFDCFKYGVFHSSVCCALWCTQISMGQIMTRLNLTYLGEPGRRDTTKDTFKIVCALFFSYTIYSIALEIAAPAPDKYNGAPSIPMIALLKALGAVTFTFYSVYALMRTRESIRIKYSIPNGKVGACEDLCVSIWCSCCAVAQMARHTGEYEINEGVCLSDRGLPRDAPFNV